MKSVARRGVPLAKSRFHPCAVCDGGCRFAPRVSGGRGACRPATTDVKTAAAAATKQRTSRCSVSPTRSPSSPAPAPASAGRPQNCLPSKAPRSSSRRAARASSTRWSPKSSKPAARPRRWPATSGDEAFAKALVELAVAEIWRPRHRLQQCRHRRRDGTGIGPLAGELAGRHRHQPDRRLPRRQIPGAGNARARRRIDHLHLDLRRPHASACRAWRPMRRARPG